MQLCLLHAKLNGKCYQWQPNLSTVLHHQPLGIFQKPLCSAIAQGLPLVSTAVGRAGSHFAPQRNEGINSKRQKQAEKNHLLDIVKTSRFRFQYGSMMKHFIESNPKEDDIKLKWREKKKKELCDTAQHDGDKVSSFSVKHGLLQEISSQYSFIVIESQKNF